ncbi:MAG: tetratricopeptide repeat protein [Acidobacteriota bacterium]
MWWSTAAEAQSGEGWSRIDTNHFTIFSQVSDDVGRQVGADLERLHQTLDVMTGAPRVELPVPTYFYIFRSEEELAPYRQSPPPPPTPRSVDIDLDLEHGMKIIGQKSSNAGYLVPHAYGTYAVVVGASDFVPTRYVYKQYLHQRLHESFPGLPYWFRQGVAEYFSSFTTEGDVAKIGRPSEEHKYWIRTRHTRPLIPAADFMAMGDADVSRGTDLEQGTYFRQAWATLHYLINRDGANAAELAAFVAATADGVPPVQAFQETYGLDLSALNAQVDAYLRQGRFRVLSMPIKKLSLLSLKFRSLPAPEAIYHLGDLLARAVPNRGIQAAAHFERALALDPNHGPAWAGLGELAENAGDVETAGRHYAKAVGLAPDHFVIQYLHGRRLLEALGGQRPADDAGEATLVRAIEALTRSVERRDEFGEAWAELAYAHGLAKEATDAGVVAIRRAMDFFPNRSDLALNLLLAHARRGERDEADALVERMRGGRFELAALNRASEVLLQMDYREAVGLVRRGDTDKAIELFGQVQARSQNPGLRATVAEQLKKLSIAGDYEAFFTLYNEAAAAINSGDTALATSLIDRIDSRYDQAWQKSQVERLRGYLAQR